MGYKFIRAAFRGKVPDTDTEVVLDWRQVHAQKPPNWPGILSVWPQDQAQDENSRLRAAIEDDRENELKQTPHYFFGTNNAGLLFTLSPEGEVFVVDECELDYPTRIAESLDELFVGSKRVAAGTAHQAN